MFIGNFARTHGRLFSFGCVIPVGFLSGSECVHGVLLVIRVMVPIYPFERFRGHTAKTCRFPRRNAALRKPCRARVA